jgi:hypothetical protein
MTLCDKVQVQRLTPWPNRLLVEVNSNFYVSIYQRNRPLRKVVLGGEELYTSGATGICMSHANSEVQRRVERAK